MQSSETKITRSYQQEDIQQILQIALSRQSDNEEFTREQLVEIATELNISPESLQSAEQEWTVKQGEIQKRQEFNLFRRRKLQKHAGNYVIVNSFLLVLNFLTTGGISQALYILVFWGLWLGIKTWNSFHTEGEEYEQAFQKWYRKHQLKKSFNTVVDKFIKAVQK